MNILSIARFETRFSLIQKRHDATAHPRYLITKEDLFQRILEAHVSTGHGGVKKTRLGLHDKYCNITERMVAIFLANCESCQKKKSKPNKGLVVKPLCSSGLGSRGQVDLIIMESQPDRDYVNIMNYQDHFTKFNFLRPLKSRTAAEVAYNLIDIFTLIGAPCILQSDNGREFAAKVVYELKELWPSLMIVHGRPRHPQSQGSVERSNHDIKQMLIAWTTDNSCSKWAEGLRFVMLQKNSSAHRNLNNRSPFEVMFGQKPLVGLQKTSLPNDVMRKLETEEELAGLLANTTPPHGETDDDDTDFVPQMSPIDDSRLSPQAAGPSSREDAEHESVSAAIAHLRATQTKARSDTDNEDEEETDFEGSLASQMSPVNDSWSSTNADDGVAPSTREDDAISETVDPLTTHVALINTRREEARKGQDKSRSEMLRRTKQRLSPFQVGDAVLIPVSEFDRGRLDSRNIPGVVVEVTPRETYRIGTEHGTVNTTFSRSELLKDDSNIVRDVNPELMSVRHLAGLHSAHGGQGFSKCSCGSTCSSKRCTCKKSAVKCNSHCHPRNGKCTNK